MRLHDRYLFRELLTPLAYCLGGFLIFWISYFFFTQLGDMQEHKFNLLDALEFAAAQTPQFFVMVLPITLLLALLYTLTHHARHHEITALRAAGISLWRLCGPYFIVGLAASGIYFLLNEIAVPRAAEWAESIKGRHVKNDRAQISKTRFVNTGFSNLRAHRTWEFGEYDATTATFRNLKIIWSLPDQSQRQLWAERAERSNGVWTFYLAQVFVQSGPGARILPQPASNILALPEFDETPQQILRELKFNSTQSLFASRSTDIPMTEIASYLRRHPELAADKAAALRTKYYDRIAAPWTCLVVVLIAIPFGAASGRRNLFYGVAGSIFITFAFFVLQRVCLALGDGGHLLPWLAAWLPNAIFATLGIFLTCRTR